MGDTKSVSMGLLFFQHHPASFHAKTFKYRLPQLKAAIQAKNANFKDQIPVFYPHLKSQKQSDVLLQDLTNLVNQQLIKQRSLQIAQDKAMQKYTVNEDIASTIQSWFISSLQEAFSQNSKIGTNFRSKLLQFVHSGCQISSQRSSDRSHKYYNLVQQLILNREGSLAEPYELVSSFSKVDESNLLFKILQYQFQGIVGDISLIDLGKNTLKMVENHFERIIPRRISDINQFISRQIIANKKQLPVYKDNYSLYKYGIVYYLLKSGQYNQLQELQLDRNLYQNIIQFFKFEQIPRSLRIPTIDDIFLQDIQYIFQCKASDPRLTQQPFDYAWRYLTLFAKHPTHPSKFLDEYQRYAYSKYKSSQLNTRKQALQHLLYSLNYRQFLQLPSEYVGVAERMHIGIVLRSAQLIEKKIFLELIKQYINQISNINMAVDYCLLLEDEEVLRVLEWYLLKKGRVQQFFGMNKETFSFQRPNQNQKVRKYFDRRAYDSFLFKIISNNNINNELTSAVLFSQELKNHEKAISSLLKIQIVDQNQYKKAVSIIQKGRLSTFQTKLLKFMKMYRSSIQMILKNNIFGLMRDFDAYFSGSLCDSEVVSYIFKNNLNLVYLNFLKSKIMYGQRINKGVDLGSIRHELREYVSRHKDSKKSMQEQELIKEIHNYLN